MTFSHHRAVALGLLLTALIPGMALPQQACPDPARFAPDATGTLAHVRYLADDALEGRAAGSRGERCAAEYLAARFEERGLQPAGERGGWFQGFPLRTGANVLSASLRIGDQSQGQPGESWTPFGFSGSGSVGGSLQSFDGEARAVHGSIAVIEVQRDNAHGLHEDPHFQVSRAASAGAVGAIVVLPDGARLPAPEEETRPAVPVPAVAVTESGAAAVRRALERGDQASISVRVTPVTTEARNVIALLPGSDSSRAHQPIIIGAHYDHLGWGGQGSLAPDAREIHNGADDNASGTAALLEAARILGESAPLARPVVFIAFSGEERGLLGSGRFVEEPTVPLDEAVAMINMDMVGRLREGRLTVFGVGTAEEWERIIQAANAVTGDPLQIAGVADGFGPSDHASFYGAGIPVLFFFTNTHAEYHRPADDWQALNVPGIDRVAAFAAEVTSRLAGRPNTQALALTPVAGAGTPQHGTSDSAPRSGGYGPYLGTIPDMSEVEGGVRLTGVRVDSPAESAGLRAGDVIVGFAGREVGDLYAYTYALRAQEPGDEVQIVVLRDGEIVTLEAVLGRAR